MRLLRCSESLLEFTLNFTGKSIPLLSAITLLIICWLAVFNAQLFGFVTNYPEGCSEISGQHFGTFVEVRGKEIKRMGFVWNTVEPLISGHLKRRDYRCVLHDFRFPRFISVKTPKGFWPRISVRIIYRCLQ